MKQIIEIKRNHADFCRGAAFSGKLEIFELKQLADMEASYKARCRHALELYKNWRRLYSQQTDMIELAYGNLEGVMLRRRAEDAVRAYWIIRRDFRGLFEEYLGYYQKNSSYKNSSRAA